MTYNGYPSKAAFHEAMRAAWARRAAEDVAAQLAPRPPAESSDPEEVPWTP